MWPLSPSTSGFCITSCTHQHTQALRSAESRQNGMSYVVAADEHQCFNGSQSRSFHLCHLAYPGKRFWCSYKYYHDGKLYLQHQHALQLLPWMKHCLPKTGKSFLLVLSQDKDGILWVKMLLGCKQSKCGFPCESCWVIQIPSCGRKWASRDSWAWKRWVTSRHFPVGLWREPLSLAEKQSSFLRDLLRVLWLLATRRFCCEAERVGKVGHSLKEVFC